MSPCYSFSKADNDEEHLLFPAPRWTSLLECAPFFLFSTRLFSNNLKLNLFLCNFHRFFDNIHCFMLSFAVLWNIVFFGYFICLIKIKILVIYIYKSMNYILFFIILNIFHFKYFFFHMFLYWNQKIRNHNITKFTFIYIYGSSKLYDKSKIIHVCFFCMSKFCINFFFDIHDIHKIVYNFFS